MPDLPTLTVTAAQAQRMLDAYGSVDGYRTWLRESIVRYVLDSEQSQMQAESLATQRDALAALRAELDPPADPPPTP